MHVRFQSSNHHPKISMTKNHDFQHPKISTPKLHDFLAVSFCCFFKDVSRGVEGCAGDMPLKKMLSRLGVLPTLADDHRNVGGR